MAVLVCGMVSPLHAATRTSANYTVVAESMDSGGATTTSTNYSNQGTAGGIGGLATASSPAITLKSGYDGQLYTVTGLTLSTTFAANGDTQQLVATQTLDDGTMVVLSSSIESWSVVSGQIPTGLTLNPQTGVVTGTPTQRGSYSFTVQVSDGLGNTAQQTYSGVVAILESDTPTMPPWALELLALLLFALAAHFLPKAAKASIQ